MKSKKKKYESPELHDLGVAEAIGACESGSINTGCDVGSDFRTTFCSNGISGIRPSVCTAGAFVVGG